MPRELFPATPEHQEQLFPRLNRELINLKRNYSKNETQQTDQIIEKLDKLSESDQLAGYMYNEEFFFFKQAVINLDARLVNYLLEKMPGVYHFSMFSTEDLQKFSKKAVALSPDEYAEHSESIRQILAKILALDNNNDPDDRTLVEDFEKGLEDEEQKPSYQAFVEDLKTAEKFIAISDDGEEEPSALTTDSSYSQLFHDHRDSSSGEDSDSEEKASPRPS